MFSMQIRIYNGGGSIMKWLTLLSVVLWVMAAPQLLFAQPDTLWTRSYGGRYNDYANSVAQTFDGGFIATGLTRSFHVVESDIYLIKSNSKGDPIWTRTYGGEFEEYGSSVAQTSDGGYIVAGKEEWFVCLVRTDSNGKMLWTRRYGLGEGLSVKETSDGGYIVVGYTYGDRGTDVYLIRTDSNGGLLWNKTCGGAYDDYGCSVVVSSDGGYIVAGYTNSYGARSWDVFLIKTDSDGKVLWSHLYGGVEADCGYSVAQTFDGGFVIGGSTASFGAGGLDFYLIRTDAHGDTLWTQTYGGVADDCCWSVAEISNSGYALAGYTKSYGAGYEDVYLIWTDYEGDTLWTQIYGGTGADRAYSLDQTFDGGCIIAGSTKSFSVGDNDVYLLRVTATVTPLLYSAQQWVPQLGTLDFRGTYYNPSQDPCTVETVFGAYRPGGTDPVRTFSNVLTFEPGTTIKYYALAVPDKAPIKKGYLLKSELIYPPGSGDVVSWDHFEFEVKPSMESVPLGSAPVEAEYPRFSGKQRDGFPDTLWTGIYGGDREDQGWSVVQTFDGCFVVAGRTTSYGSGLQDAYLMKVDPSGDTIWTRTYGGSSWDFVYSIAETSDSGYIVVGRESSYGSGGVDVWLIKTDANGDTIWTRNYGGPDWEEGNAGVQTSDGGYILVGVTYSYGAGESDVYLIKTDSSGDTLWTRTFGGPDVDEGWSVAETPDGGYIVAAVTGDYTWEGDVYVIKTNADGDSLWTRIYGGSKHDEGRSVAVTPEGDYVIAGTYAKDYVYLIKIDSNGNTLWTKTYGKTREDYGYSVAVASDGGYFVVGYNEFSIVYDFDVYLIRTDSNGDTLWTRTYGGTKDDYGLSVAATADGGCIVAGFTESFNTDVCDIYLIRVEGTKFTHIIDPAQTWVPRLGTLDFQVLYVNPSQGPWTVEVLIEAYRPGGTDPVRAFSGILTFDPGWTTKYYALTVPGAAPKRPGYLLKAKAIDPPGSSEVVSWDAFEFEVKPEMVSVPFD
jgi:hypothetical protein